jgi:hypothetical protein
MSKKKLITFWADKEIHAMLDALSKYERKKKSQILRDMISLEFFQRRLHLKDFKEE